LAIIAKVGVCARFTVVTIEVTGQRSMLADASPHTGVGGAPVEVVAILGCSGFAEPLVTEIIDRAGIHVIACSTLIFLLVNAALSRVTDVRGAGIEVVTIHHLTAQAHPPGASVTRSTGVVVVTRETLVHGLVEAAESRFTPIVGTGIKIVTKIGLAGLAASFNAKVSSGARITIVAGQAVGNRIASRLNVARVVGAVVVVVAIGEFFACFALTLTAVVPNGAGITVVTICFGGQDTAHPRLIADALRARRVALTASIDDTRIAAAVVVATFEAGAGRFTWGAIVLWNEEVWQQAVITVVAVSRQNAIGCAQVTIGLV
jgi:hypothetical protein